MSEPSKEDLPALPELYSAPQADVVDSDPQLEPDAARKKLEKTLLRKLDIRMSILIIMFIFDYIDGGDTAMARLGGFENDLGLKGTEFSSVLSIYYVGFLLMQIPSNMLLTRIGKPSVYLSCCMTGWGVVSLCTGFVTNYPGTLLSQFFLGFMQAAFYPGGFFLVTKWYKRKELSKRLAFLSCGGVISSAFGSLIASGILARLDGVRGYPGWRWLFFIEGALTVLFAVLAFYILPDFPEAKSIRWLTSAEHALARERMVEDSAGEPYPMPGEANRDENSTVGPMLGFVMAMKDWKVWYFTFMAFLTVTASSFLLYFPTLTSTMGYNPTITLILCVPPWLVGVVWVLWLSWHSDKRGERCMHTVVSYAVGIIGFILAMSTMNTVIRYISLFFMIQSFTSLVFLFAWASSTVSDPPAKRAVALAIINSVSQVGSIVGSYFWPISWEPTYNKSYAICMAGFLLCIAMCLWLRGELKRLNGQMDLANVQDHERMGSRNNKWRYLL